MCGIAYKRKQDLKDYFDIAFSRGTDGIGILGSGGSVWKGYATSLTTFTTRFVGSNSTGGNWYTFTDESLSDRYWELKGNVSWGDIYQSILNNVLRQRNKKEYALIHHRKTSIGSDSIDNVHPFPISNGRFFLLQNGSSQIIHDWGVINFLSEVKTHSDTYYLSKFIEEKGCTSLNEVADILGKLIKTGVNLGVICVVDTSNDTILLLSDGCRSLYIDMDISETAIHSFSSLDEYGKDDFFFRGFIVLDFEGNILNMKYEYMNKVPEKKTYPIKTYNQPAIPYASGYEEEDDYYEKKKEKSLALTSLGELVSWRDSIEESENIDWIDPALVIDSTDLQKYTNQFWEIESDLAERHASGMGQGQQWNAQLSNLRTIANLIDIEMSELCDEFCESFSPKDSGYLWKYIEGEKTCIMEAIMVYDDNFEFDN